MATRASRLLGLEASEATECEIPRHKAARLTLDYNGLLLRT